MENNRLIEILNRMEELQQEFFSELRIQLTGVNKLPAQIQQDSDDRLNRQQVIDYLEIGESTYKRWVKAGLLRPMKMPGGHRYYKKDLTDAFNESIRKGKI